MEALEISKCEAFIILIINDGLGSPILIPFTAQSTPYVQRGLSEANMNELL